LGYEPTKMGFVLKNEAKKRIEAYQKRFGIFFDLDAKPPQLSACDRQKIEILKVLYRGAEIIIMDEPTSLLTPNEKDTLIEVLINMAKEGICSVPFITHKLPEVMKLSNYLTILRRGKVVATLSAAEIKNEESLAEKMVGRKVLFNLKKEEVPKGKELLSAENIEAFDERGIKRLHGVSFVIKEGEILGLAGVSGNGQRELVKVIMGLLKPSNGKIMFDGKDITNIDVNKRRELGFAYIPDDRLNDGIVPSLSIKENLIVGLHKRDKFRNGMLIDYDSAGDYAKKLVRKFNIDTSDIEKKVGKLSGGNIQKIVLARELSRNPSFILADKPTRGLDVGSQEYTRKVLLEERKKGKAILLISEDLDEISMISDRITVICQGKIVGDKACKETSKEEIGILMAGSKIKK
jgi:simple sugar transport system ATP-binding protein